MTHEASVDIAADLMRQFAARTGLDPAGEKPQRRYLWTDAFAVMNFLGPRTDLALRLIERVHETLGRERPDSRKTGWISGLSEPEGAAHPTMGGLRIGKPQVEGAGWDEDGQYFHYLTKWMQALEQTARHTGDVMLHRWARELAVAAHRAFVYKAPTGMRMYWKMSIDLSSPRPLVRSMGQHDPLDGLVTYLELGDGLEDAINDFQSMIDQRSLPTDDPLGLGGLLTDAARLRRLEWNPLAEQVLEAARAGLRVYGETHDLALPADRRLAFRELGLAIGLAATPMDERLRRTILEFWLEPAHRLTPLYQEHLDINDVMLATALRS